MKIYIAGPYTNHDLNRINENVNRAILAGLEIYKKGHVPFIPHLTHFIDLVAKEQNIQMNWEDYIKIDLSWLDSCDGLLYLDPSPGANIELEHAKQKGLKIFNRIQDIPSTH